MSQNEDGKLEKVVRGFNLKSSYDFSFSIAKPCWCMLKFESYYHYEAHTEGLIKLDNYDGCWSLKIEELLERLLKLLYLNIKQQITPNS